MSRKLWLLILGAFVATAYAGQNERGTSGAPISVTTVAKVLAGKPFRHSWCILPETVAIRCMQGGSDDTAASPAPSSTVGFYFPAGLLACVNTGTGQGSGQVDPTLRLDCCSTAGATNVSTWTTP